MSTSVFISQSRPVETSATRSSEFISSPLPEWIWSGVEHLYQSVFSSRVMLEKPEQSQTLLCAWVEKNEHQITNILIFCKKECIIQVCNEVIALSSGVIEQFSKDIFSNYPTIKFIRLHAIKLQSSFKNLLAFKSEFSEDYILNIPSSKESWLASLTPKVREKQCLYVKKATSGINGVKFTVVRNSEIKELMVRHVLRFSHDRMKQKGKAFGISVDEANQLCSQMKKVGCLFLLKKNDEICAGVLCSVIDSDVYMHVLAHDQKYNSMRLGLVCCFLTIEYVISQKYRRLHFLWGHYDYKKKMGAKPVVLCNVLVVKSLSKCLLHPLLLGQWCCHGLRDMMRKYRHRYSSKN